MRSDYGSPMAYGSKPTLETLDDVFRRLSPHQIIPSSEIRKIRVLGSGTFGEVALGEWLGTQVALKTQKEQVAQMKPDFKSEFQVELSVLSQLSHSKIVRYLGACLSPPIMVLEYYSMGSLDDVIHGNRAQLSHGQSLAIALDISLGMVYLHHKKVLHRDLKPQNVLVDGALQARIADFGLAKHPFVVEASENGLTGTVPYMAPEILSARPYGLPVDVYAYAVLVNEMLTKQRPYDGNSPEWVVSAVINTEARPLTATSSPIFQNLIKKCWVKDPNARPKFAEVEIYLKNGIATTSNAQHISNTLVTTVSKLVSEMQLTNTTGRVDSAQKLRDMLDPAQDLYQVEDVQEAVRLAGGITPAAQLLKVDSTVSFRLEPSDLRVVAAELLGNACVDNNSNKEQAGTNGAPILLVKLLQKPTTAEACRACTRALLVMCDKHESNCQQAIKFDAVLILTALASRCAPHPPSFPNDADDSSWIPGLQEDDAELVASGAPNGITPVENSSTPPDDIPPVQNRARTLSAEGRRGNDILESILNANHSVLDIDQSLRTPRSMFTDLDLRQTPSKQELKRNQIVETELQSALRIQTAILDVTLDAGFPELILQTLVAISNMVPGILKEIAAGGYVVLTRFLFHSSSVVQKLAGNILTAINGQHPGEASLCMLTLPPKLLLELLLTQPTVSNIAERALIRTRHHARHHLQHFWTSGCVTHFVQQIEKGERTSTWRKEALEAVIGASLEVECNKSPFVKTHGIHMFTNMLQNGPETVDRVIACQMLHRLGKCLAPSDRTAIVNQILSSNLVSDLPVLPHEDQKIVISLLAGCSESSQAAKAAVRKVPVPLLVAIARDASNDSTTVTMVERRHFVRFYCDHS